MTELSPDQRGKPIPEQFADTLRALRDPQTPEERQRARESRARIRETEARLRRALRPAHSAEVLSTRIGPYCADVFSAQRDEDQADDPLQQPRFTHELPLREDPQTLDEN